MRKLPIVWQACPGTAPVLNTSVSPMCVKDCTTGATSASTSACELSSARGAASVKMMSAGGAPAAGPGAYAAADGAPATSAARRARAPAGTKLPQPGRQRASQARWALPGLDRRQARVCRRTAAGPNLRLGQGSRSTRRCVHSQLAGTARLMYSCAQSLMLLPHGWNRQAGSAANRVSNGDKQFQSVATRSGHAVSKQRACACPPVVWRKSHVVLGRHRQALLTMTTAQWQQPVHLQPVPSRQTIHVHALMSYERGRETNQRRRHPRLAEPRARPRLSSTSLPRRTAELLASTSSNYIYSVRNLPDTKRNRAQHRTSKQEDDVDGLQAGLVQTSRACALGLVPGRHGVRL
jgi:hypothetical protein